MLRPTTLGSDPNRDAQNPWLSTTTRALVVRSSSGEIVRPSRGTAPSTSKKVPDTPMLATLVGSPPPSPSSTSVQADEPTEATRPTCAVAAPMFSTWR